MPKRSSRPLRRGGFVALAAVLLASCGDGGGAETSGHLVVLRDDRACLSAGSTRDCFEITDESEIAPSVGLGKMVTVSYRHPGEIIEIVPVEAPPG